MESLTSSDDTETPILRRDQVRFILVWVET